ncbi:hypothetical protein [Halogranum rubrum]|uniref:Uncharacterized protein n=1 Tax=Halogranum salarium B-1 TaxID=1210908 RepID=J2ZI89_9EURY|nr:hypothetical protein [Halogranum salarium]EJN60430.1 hypothetical protein HSB1_10330 [Halogranum salarium B-1]
MLQCSRPGCGWQAFAPSAAAAREQYLIHLVEAHATDVDAEIPDGMVQVHVGDGEWMTVSFDEATELHELKQSTDVSTRQRERD